MLGILLFVIYFATVSTMKYAGNTKMKNSQALDIPEEKAPVEIPDTWELDEVWSETNPEQAENDDNQVDVETSSETDTYVVEPANLLSDNDLIEYAKGLGIKATKRWKRETILTKIQAL